MTDPHPLIVGLANAVPPKGTDFPREKRELWFKTAALCFDLIFGEVAAPQPVTKPAMVLTPSPEGAASPPAPTPEATQREGGGEDQAEPVRLPDPPPPPLNGIAEMADASLLKPLSRQQADVFAAVTKIHAAGRKGTLAGIARDAKIPEGSASAILYALGQKSYVANFGVYGSPDWRPIVGGEPIVGSPTTKPAPAPPPPSPVKNDSAPFSHPLQHDDLSARQRSVLVLVEKGDLSDRTLKLVSIGPAELPKVLLRLRDLGTIELAEGKWMLTEAGQRIVAVIQAKPTPKIEAKVSMPVVKTVEPAKVPLKDDPAARAAIDAFAEKNGVRRFDTADSAAPFNLAEYLIKKGHAVTGSTVWGGRAWKIDGKPKEWDEVIALVNKYRAKADLPPLNL